MVAAGGVDFLAVAARVTRVDKKFASASKRRRRDDDNDDDAGGSSASKVRKRARARDDAHRVTEKSRTLRRWRATRRRSIDATMLKSLHSLAARHACARRALILGAKAAVAAS